MRLDTIFRVATKLIIPFILVFALYVHFHGDYGPGGGFQAGVIAAGSIILYAIIFGVRAAQRIVPQWLVALLVPAGVLIYSVTGAVSFIYGLNYMDYAALAHDSKHGHHLGILLVETGVIVTVASTMTAIFYAFVERGR
ncbi:MAG: Na(+)/H(+) antiporter subunit B [Hyphomicrobiaceae bacterium]